jgi:hypothetical protein
VKRASDPGSSTAPTRETKREVEAPGRFPRWKKQASAVIYYSPREVIMCEKPNDSAAPTARAEKWARLGIRETANCNDVCSDCIGDRFLGEFISNAATKKKCTYCGKQGSAAARPLAEVVEYIAEKLSPRASRTRAWTTTTQATNAARSFPSS